MTQRENHPFVRLILFAVLMAFCMSIAGVVDAQKIPQRNEIENKYKWRVEDIYADIAAWERDFSYLKDNLGRFGQYKGKLSEPPAQLLACLKLSDSLNIIESNLYVYASLKLDEDNRKSEFQELTGRISMLSSELGEATSFIEPELIAIPADMLNSMLKSSPELDEYGFYLSDLTRQKEHILSDKEEALLALAGPMAGASSRIFNMIDNADLKLGTIKDADGSIVELTWGRYSRIMEDSNRELRRTASDTVQVQYLKYVNSLAASLGGSLNHDLFFAKARHYETCLDMSLNANNISTTVYHNLIKTVNANLEPLHRYARLRKEYLGYDTLHTFDLSVPLGAAGAREYSYEEACQILLEGLKPLGDKYLVDLDKGFNSGWVDVYETEAKATGAYSWGTYTSHPYVLMNYASRLDDVFTLAHEMGHAMNSFYANQNEPYQYHNHSLFTAEVASTCNEAILMKYLLQHTTDKNEKLRLVNYYLRQIIVTFWTQVLYAEFELAIHERVESGDAVSADYFRKTYRDIFQKYYGPTLYIGPNNDQHGLRIGHFYWQYYVYQYATCYAAAQALSQKIMENQPGALEAYHRFLATGSSKYPVDILKEAGVDMTSPEPIERTIGLFNSLLNELEALLKKG